VVRNKPKLFIGSSVEGLEVAYAIQTELEHDSEPTVWSQGVFNLTQSTLHDLLSVLDTYDAAIFVMSPDDVIKMRGQSHAVTRDNVIFELGMFIGRLGPERTFMVTPRNSQDLHIPTDLLGITPGIYDNERSDGNLQAALGPFCFKVRNKLTQITKKVATQDNHKSEIDIKYNDLVNKLIQLGGYHRIIENQDLPSDSMLASYHELRAEVFKVIKSDFGNLLEMITASGILTIFFGNIYENAYFSLDVKNVSFLENHFIEFEAAGITQSSMTIPNDIVEWFGDRYEIKEK